MRGLAALAAVSLGVPLVVAGCGSSPGDILGLGISGGPPRKTFHMHVMEDGRASCNTKPLHQISSSLLLDARNVIREAKPLVQRSASFGVPSPDRRNFELLTPDGRVTWVEAAPGLPIVLPQAEELALELQQQLC
jgi:hypothetical protein